MASDGIRWILVVDDNEEIRDLVSLKLKKAFKDTIRIVEACDGVEATNKLGFQSFDCIVTDLQMPRREGTAFIKIVKGSQLNSKTPIVILTGFPDPSVFDNFGAITMLEKPFKEDEFIKVITAQLQLGSTDNKISSNLINLLLEATAIFLKEQNITSAQEKPTQKIPGIPSPGERFVSLDVRSGPSSGRFVFGFEDSLVQKLKTPTFPNDPTVSNEILLKKLANLIFMATSKTSIFQNMHSTAPQLISMNVAIDKTSPLFATLTGDKGIIVPIKTPDGCIFITTIVSKA